jgi:hypothetical protein
MVIPGTDCGRGNREVIREWGGDGPLVTEEACAFSSVREAVAGFQLPIWHLAGVASAPNFEVRTPAD